VKKLKRKKAEMISKNTIVQKISLLAFALFFLTPFSFLSAQTTEVKPKVVIVPNKQKFKIKQKIKTVSNENSSSAEKSIAVDSKVSVSLCVSEGKLKGNGWERNEIRAFVGGGSQVGFRVQQKSEQNGTPIWVIVLGFDPTKDNENGADECLSGEEIELDVPRGAIVNVKGSEAETTIDSVRKVTVLIDGGDIFLNNIAQGIEARTFEGDVTVENSSGAMTLTCTTGNIVAFDVGASEIGDVFKAKTSSGAITLQKIRHRQTEVGSNSGSIRFNGEFQSGGQYTLGTQNGSILLSIPEKCSFKLNASYGFGVFSSDIPLQNQIKTTTSRAQSLSAQCGSGDASLSLKTVSGAVRIRKQ
jgi:Putative adhesin